MARYDCRPAHRPRRARAQPQERHRQPPSARSHLHHRAVRLRKVLARIRHDLRGRAAPVRGVALRLRAAVPPDDGEAGRGLDRRALACDLDRPEDDIAQPALDGGDRDGDLRLPAPAVRADRAAALPGLRAAHRRAVARPDRRAGAPASGRHEVHGERAGRARSQGRVQGRARGTAPRRLHAREGGRRAAAARGDDRARQEVQAHDRGRRRPARHEGGPAPPAHTVDRDGDLAGRRSRRDRRRGRRGAHVLREPRVPRARGLAAGARAARLLLQLAARRLPPLHRARLAARDRSGSPRAGHVADDLGRGARAVDDREPELLRQRHPGDRRALRDLARDALARSLGRRAGPFSLRHRRRPRLRHLPEPDGTESGSTRWPSKGS